jgi:hypothetical protein
MAGGLFALARFLPFLAIRPARVMSRRGWAVSSATFDETITECAWDGKRIQKAAQAIVTRQRERELAYLSSRRR